jgi:pimeloyl-ACP methyl ester carboxylesterase
LVHGGVAHKSWWDFIAPFFLPHYRVMALDLSGMGRSDWREFYDMPTYADEVLAAADAAGLFAARQKPWLVGHSFGGFVTLGFAARHGDQIEGAVVIDSPVRPADKQRRSAPPSRGGKVYDTLEAALARFRLLPSQECDNLFLVDHIARNSLKEVDAGWTWRFDPQLWSKMRYDMRAAIEVLNELKCPITLIRGEQSSLVSDEVWGFMKQAFPGEQHHMSIPQSQHHVMLDQPLALVSALRAIFGSGI